MNEPSVRRRTALYDPQVALGARMVEFAGYDTPVQCDGILAEHQRMRREATRAAISNQETQQNQGRMS
ncbi:MAG: hypothetical protein IPK80_34580 [Nannocystis sp.]|nr:hypothetical protein [Nannocystis sp.]